MSRSRLKKGERSPCSIMMTAVSVSRSPIGPMLLTRWPSGYWEEGAQESTRTTMRCERSRSACRVPILILGTRTLYGITRTLSVFPLDPSPFSCRHTHIPYNLASEASLHSHTNGAIFLYIYISLTNAATHTVMFYVDSNFGKLQYSVCIMRAPLRSPKMPCIRSSNIVYVYRAFFTHTHTHYIYVSYTVKMKKKCGPTSKEATYSRLSLSRIPTTVPKATPPPPPPPPLLSITAPRNTWFTMYQHHVRLTHHQRLS